MGNSVLARAEHKIYITIKRLRLKNHNPTIIASNCNGGIILHDLGLKFNTPTINLYFDPADFLRFVSDLDGYLAKELAETDSGFDYPAGLLGDVKIYFMHYPSFAEAKKKWDERAKRINKENLFVLMTDQNGCTKEQMKQFDNLPFPNKLIFTHVPQSDIKSAVYMKGFENDEEVGILSDWKPGFWKRRYIDDYDYITFLK